LNVGDAFLSKAIWDMVKVAGLIKVDDIDLV